MSILDFFRGQGEPVTLERLDAVFHPLEANRVMARLYPESGRSEGHLFIRQELAEAEHRGQVFDGFCFCDQHSMQALDEGALTFNFGSAQPLPTYRALWSAQVHAGQQVAQALTNADFHVQWDGEPSTVIAIVDVRWEGPREKAGLTGARLPLRKPKPPPSEPQATIFVGSPVPGALGHQFLSRIAALKGTKMYGAVTGETNAAIDYQGAATLFDFVTGASNAPGPIGAYLLRTRDLVSECRLLVDVVARSESKPCSFWGSWGFGPEQRVRVVCSGVTEPTFEGSQAIAIGGDPASLEKALGAIEQLATQNVRA